MLLRIAVSVIFSSVVFGQTYIISTFAGGVPPDNILGTSAGLGNIQAVAVDSAHNIFILSYYAVFRLDATTGTLSRVAGNGTAGFSGDNGPATNAQINGTGIAIDSSGNLYIADLYRIRKVSNGVITTVAGVGTCCSSGDNGTATSAQLVPTNIAVDSAGNLYIAGDNRIRKISNGVITTVAGDGTAAFSGDNGPATSAELSFPQGIAVDSVGNVYVASDNRIRKISNGVITTVAGNGTRGSSGDNGPATSAQLALTAGVAVDSAGNIYIADSSANRIRMVSNGVITTVVGTGVSGFSGDNGPPASAQLSSPSGVAVDSAGNLYFGDEGLRIRKVSNGVISTVAGGSDDNSPASSVQVGSSSVTVDSTGNLYILDGHRIRKISNGVITTVAGNGTYGFSGDDGLAASAQLDVPFGTAVDAAGNLYIADSVNNRIRKVSNGVITTVAGNGTAGFSGDNGPAAGAKLNGPRSLAVDSAGNLYIDDFTNRRIRKVSNGVITTVAGNGTDGFSGDNGPATGARMSSTAGVAVDSSGNLYIADRGNLRVRKVSNGVITTVAGNGTFGFSGDNGPATSAQLAGPGGIAVDSAGNLYISDPQTNRIRMISNGVITTVAGNGTAGFSGDNGPGTNAQLSNPAGVAVDPTGSVYFADNIHIRVLTPPLTNKNSASFAPAELAPNTIAFGEASGIAPRLIVAPDGPWPASLGGVSLEITDSQGQKLLAPIYFVTTNAIGYLIPAGAASGPATVKLTVSTGATISGTIVIARTSPALYTANSSGSGVPAGFWIRAAANSVQTQDYLFDPTKPVGSRVAIPVDLGASGDQVFLSLYGTGFRGATQAIATVGGVTVPVSGFAAVGIYQGEDVVNLGPLPRSLAGQGVVNIVVNFDGKLANTVTASIR